MKEIRSLREEQRMEEEEGRRSSEGWRGQIKATAADPELRTGGGRKRKFKVKWDITQPGDAGTRVGWGRKGRRVEQ